MNESVLSAVNRCKTRVPVLQGLLIYAVSLVNGKEPGEVTLEEALVLVANSDPPTQMPAIDALVSAVGNAGVSKYGPRAVLCAYQAAKQFHEAIQSCEIALRRYGEPATSSVLGATLAVLAVPHISPELGALGEHLIDDAEMQAKLFLCQAERNFLSGGSVDDNSSLGAQDQNALLFAARRFVYTVYLPSGADAWVSVDKVRHLDMLMWLAGEYRAEGKYDQVRLVLRLACKLYPEDFPQTAFVSGTVIGFVEKVKRSAARVLLEDGRDGMITVSDLPGELTAQQAELDNWSVGLAICVKVVSSPDDRLDVELLSLAQCNCGETVDVRVTVDPFGYDIGGDDTLHAICPACISKSSDNR